MSAHASYALVTPARDEEENLGRLAESLAAQSILPARWVVVDNGSTDGTAAVTADLSARHPWICAASSPGARSAAPGAPVVRGFHTGLADVPPEADVVVKLDADVTLDTDYFERLLAAFAEDPRLGIAGGACLELENGEWRPVPVTGDHVRGAVRAYRKACLADVLPLEERLGWDGIDELRAQVRGWRTGTIPGLAFRHHRSLGARDGTRFARWLAQGRGAYFMGYRPSYLALRALHRARSDPAALAMVWAYAAALVRREPRYADKAVVAHLRREQRLSRLRVRAREARGRA